MGDGALVDLMVHDGLTCAVANVHMGIHGGNVAAEVVTREDQDAWLSDTSALAAMDNGLFGEEITPVEVVSRRSTEVIETDEAPRRETSLEALAKLKFWF